MKAERPQIPGTAEAKAKAKHAQQVRDVEELEQDLQEQAEADAQRTGSKSKQQEEDAAAAEAAAIADAQEKTAFVQKILEKESKRKASAGGMKNSADTALYPDEVLATEGEEQDEEKAMEMELADVAEEEREIEIAAEEEHTASVVSTKHAAPRANKSVVKQVSSESK